MIRARIRKKLGAFTLDVDFEASSGVTVLFGASGAGKTLTLDCIAGFQKPDAGRILLDDALLYDGETGVHLPPQKRNCGYVFQNYALFPHMTLRENLAFAVERLPRLERHRRINDMIERFKLTEVADRRPDGASGGQQQRCSIARALISSPRLLLLDEPARGLDAPLRADLYFVIRQVRTEFQTPVLLVTHDLEECFELAQEMLVMRGGRIVQAGVPSAIADRPASLDVAQLLGLHNVIKAEILQLDPQRNSSILRIRDHEVQGRYYPGRLKGDQVTVCVRHSGLTAYPRNGKLGLNQIPATLEQVKPRPHGALLEFVGGLAVETVGSTNVNEKDWVIEFRPEALHVLSK